MADFEVNYKSENNPENDNLIHEIYAVLFEKLMEVESIRQVKSKKLIKYATLDK